MSDGSRNIGHAPQRPSPVKILELAIRTYAHCVGAVGSRQQPDFAVVIELDRLSGKCEGKDRWCDEGHGNTAHGFDSNGCG